ncbi:MAG: SRPBCC family protein [Chromatiaceae bacterium]
MFKIIAIAIAVVIAALLVYAAFQPDTFRVERSIGIKAPPEKIHALIEDLRAMQTWSAWEKVDPGMKRAHSGAARGVGAVYEWEGNNDIGQGRMEITGSSPSRVVIRMDFIKPFAAQNTLELTLQPEGDATRVTEAISGPAPYISKLLGIFYSMDKMIGGKFEESLAGLKTVAEQ